MCKTSYEAGLRHAEKSSAKKIDELQSALRVIYTWAAHDYNQGTFSEMDTLNRKHVMNLCDKALKA